LSGNGGRIENSIKNSAVGIASQVVTTIVGLIVRTVFIRQLNSDYLGVNGLFSNILTMLSLAEMGLGSAIVYNMYKPLAEHDEKQLARLLNLYKSAYRVIGVIVAAIGLAIIPFMGFIIKNPPAVDHLTFIYILFLANTVSSYYFAYKRSLYQADQKQRVIKAIHAIIIITKGIFEILILILSRNYVLYVVIQIAFTFLENLIISIRADKEYDFLKKYKAEVLPKNERKSIFENIKATFLYKFGGVALNGTDNIIISALNGVTDVGLLSNYSLFTTSIDMFLGIVSGSLTGSVGNFIAKEPAERHEKLLNDMTFLHFVMYGLIMVGSVAVLNPIIVIWAGPEYLLGTTVVLVHCLNLYINGMLGPVWTFRSTMGLFVYGKWRPMISAIVNLVVSIALGKMLGLIGVLLGTTVTRVFTNSWYDPYVIYKHGLKKSVGKYYIRQILYTLVCGLDVGAILLIQKMLPLTGIIAVLIYGILAVIIFALSVVIFYGRSSEMVYFKTIAMRAIIR